MIPGAGSPHIARLGRAMAAGGRPRLNAGAKKAYNPGRVLRNLPTNAALSGRQIAQAAHALTALETQPTIKGYRQIIGQLGQAKSAQDQGFANLGQRTTQNVSGVYRNIAESEAKTLASQQALGSKLNERSGQIAAQGNQELTGMQTGSLSQLTSQLAMRGAPGGGEAQQALANAVASQRATQSADSQAAQQFAASQGANASILAAGMGGAAQMQGGAMVGQIGRDIAARTAESDLKFNQNIQTAQQKLGEAQAQRGPDFIKNLLGLRGGEQKFALGQAAVGVNRAKNAIARTKLGIDQQNANSRAISANASLANAQTNAWKAHHPGASSAAAQRQQEKNLAYVKEIKALIPQAAAAIAPNERNNIQTYNAYINSKASAPANVVRAVIKHWFKMKASREHQSQRPIHPGPNP